MEALGLKVLELTILPVFTLRPSLRGPIKSLRPFTPNFALTSLTIPGFYYVIDPRIL